MNSVNYSNLKICLLAGINSIHTVRWANALANRGYEVHLITQHNPGNDYIDEKIYLHYLPFSSLYGYLFNVLSIRKLLKKISPDILNVHYASGYGTLARLSNFHPSVLSVWGSDVYDFPMHSSLHKNIVASNIQYADWICSTSQVMAEQVKTICPDIQNITITPFGIDVEKFKPICGLKKANVITIGTVKTLASKYAIDILVRAFGCVNEKLAISNPELNRKLRLMIVGDGPQRKELESLVAQLDLREYVQFVGKVPHEEVPSYLNQFDIYVAVSRKDSESFGVAVLEASACGLPVIVSNVGGLPEVVDEGTTGYIVPKEDPNATAEAIISLAENPILRKQMGEAGIKQVHNQYLWFENITLMEKVYHHVFNLNKLKP